MDVEANSENRYEASSLVENRSVTSKSSDKRTRIYLCCHLLAVMGTTIASLYDIGMIRSGTLAGAVAMPLYLVANLGMLFLIAAPLASLWFLIQALRSQPWRLWALAAELCL